MSRVLFCPSPSLIGKNGTVPTRAHVFVGNHPHVFINIQVSVSILVTRILIPKNNKKKQKNVTIDK